MRIDAAGGNAGNQRAGDLRTVPFISPSDFRSPGSCARRRPSAAARIFPSFPAELRILVALPEVRAREQRDLRLHAEAADMGSGLHRHPRRFFGGVRVRIDVAVSARKYTPFCRDGRSSARRKMPGAPAPRPDDVPRMWRQMRHVAPPSTAAESLASGEPFVDAQRRGSHGSRLGAQQRAPPASGVTPLPGPRPPLDQRQHVFAVSGGSSSGLISFEKSRPRADREAKSARGRCSTIAGRPISQRIGPAPPPPPPGWRAQDALRPRPRRR